MRLIRRLTLVAVAGSLAVAVPVAVGEPSNDLSITLTRYCTGSGSTLASVGPFSAEGVSATWAVHMDGSNSIFVITYWSVFNPNTGITTLVRDVSGLTGGAGAVREDVCVFTMASGRVFTVKGFFTPAGP
jgi:hypothetical protein